nr:retrotransposable element Tf2 [Tanacetum cinerariifolium]
MVNTRTLLTNTNPPNGVNSTNTAALDDQTKAFIQQLIDSAMAGIQASFQESIRQVVIQQDYLVAAVNRLKTGEGTSNRLQFGRITKLEFPKFTGVDVKNWLYKCQQFFSVEHVDDADKVKLASIHFFDNALVWHQQFEKLNGNSVSWEDYQKALLARFDTDFEDPLYELKNLKCDSTVQKYHEKFELLLNKVEMPKTHAISLFLGGMPQSISLPVRMFKPKSLSDTASLCKATIAAHKVKQSPILPKPNTGYGSFGNRGGYVAPRNLLLWHYLLLRQLLQILLGKPHMEMYAMEGVGEEFVMPEVTNEEIPQIFLNALTGITSYRTMRVIGHFGKQKIHILIDSGSTHNFVDIFMAKKLGCKIHKIDPLQVVVADGNKLVSDSMCRGFSWMLHEEKFTSDVMLLPLGGCEMVLGVQWLATLGDIMWNFTSLRHEGRQVALRGTTKSPMQWLSGKQLTKHVTQKTAICVPANSVMSLDSAHKPVFGTTDNQALEELLKEFDDVFALPTVLPPQRHHDHRIPLKEGATPVNIRPYKHPPRYHQIRMDENDIPKTSFKTHEGHYEFLVMPFGLTNAPSTFQSLMNQVFKLFLRKFTLVFFDDILVYSANVTNHLLHLRRFIQNYTTIAQPLIALLKKNAFQWNDQATQVFEALKIAMTKAPVLKLPDFDAPFVVETHASGIGIGAVLQQGGHPVAYLSKTLAPKHHSLSAYEKELLAVIMALERWRGYLQDMHFQIKTDHFSLKYFLDQRITTPFQSKWLPKLLGFDYEILYRKGKDNQAADALSRTAHGGELSTMLVTSIFSGLIEEVKK